MAPPRAGINAANNPVTSPVAQNRRVIMWSIKDRAIVVGNGAGWIVKVRQDSSGEAIFDVLLDSAQTFDNLYIARRCELKKP